MRRRSDTIASTSGGRDHVAQMLGGRSGGHSTMPPRDAVELDQRQRGRELIAGREQHRAAGKLRQPPPRLDAVRRDRRARTLASAAEQKARRRSFEPAQRVAKRRQGQLCGIFVDPRRNRRAVTGKYDVVGRRERIDPERVLEPRDQDREAQRVEAGIQQHQVVGQAAAASCCCSAATCWMATLSLIVIDILRRLLFFMLHPHTVLVERRLGSSPLDYGQLLMRRFTHPQIRSRQIDERISTGWSTCLTRGFRDCARAHYWQRALEKLASHPTPAGICRNTATCWRAAATVVGVILLIFSSIPRRGAATTRCNVSSWYVEPRLPRPRIAADLAGDQAQERHLREHLAGDAHAADRRGAGLLALQQRAIRRGAGVKHASRGGAVKVFAGRRPRPARAFRARRARSPAGRTREHGCMSLWCVTSERAYPFVFMPRGREGYHSVRAAGLLPRHRRLRPVGAADRPAIWRRGRPLVIIDSNGPIPGLVGKLYRRQGAQIFQGTGPAAVRRSRLHRSRDVRALRTGRHAADARAA